MWLMCVCVCDSDGRCKRWQKMTHLLMRIAFCWSFVSFHGHRAHFILNWNWLSNQPQDYFRLLFFLLNLHFFFRFVVNFYVLHNTMMFDSISHMTINYRVNLKDCVCAERIRFGWSCRSFPPLCLLYSWPKSKFTKMCKCRGPRAACLVQRTPLAPCCRLCLRTIISGQWKESVETRSTGNNPIINLTRIFGTKHINRVCPVRFGL